MKKLALCIGNNAYSILPELSCCVSDANAVKLQLEQLGFETIIGTNLDRDNMVSVLSEFYDKIDNYDAVILYYAGHGFQVDGDNILAPIDLNVNSKPAAIKMSAYPLSEVLMQLNRFPEQTKIIILDACRETLGYRGTSQDFAPVLAPQGSLVAFSTSPGQSSKENSRSMHGRYTEALLRYMSLPRIPVETVFKKVRESLVSDSGGAQIPWEHTSLIGEFYLNPDTIYDGINYSKEAKADRYFIFLESSQIKPLVDNLKSRTWPKQEQAVNCIKNIDFEKTSNNELFVLGRNVYQAACGNSFACQRFINNFGSTPDIPNSAKVHILNGMAYEIYFDSRNRLREKFKTWYLPSIMRYLEQHEYYASKEFIASHLYKIDDRPIYIPGQNEMMYFDIKGSDMKDGYHITDIFYKGKSILKYNNDGSMVYFGGYYTSCSTFENSAASLVAAPVDRVTFQYEGAFLSPEARIQLQESDYVFRYLLK